MRGADMPTIRIDDEVMEILKKKAVQRELVFGTPNQVLRSEFGLDGDEFNDNVVENAQTKDLAKVQSESGRLVQGSEASRGVPTVERSGRRSDRCDHVSASGRMILGRELVSTHTKLPPTKKALSSINGNFYNRPTGEEYPVILFDKGGYIIFQTESEMTKHDGVYLGKRLGLRDGIHTLPGYVKCM